MVLIKILGIYIYIYSIVFLYYMRLYLLRN